MSRKYLVLGKILVLFLAIATPAFLFLGFQDHRELLRRDAALKATVSEDRAELAVQTAIRFFQEPEQLEKALLSKPLPDGPIQGDLPAWKWPELRELSEITQGKTSAAKGAQLRLLRDEGRFFSGLPKRYAGLIEILRGGAVQMSAKDLRRLDQVAAEFARGVDLDQETFAFLLTKPPDFALRYFDRQQALAGQILLGGRPILVKTTLTDKIYLLAPDEDDLAALNLKLQALELDTQFEAATGWNHMDGLTATLDAVHQPRPVPVNSAAMRYLGIGILIELVLILIGAVLSKYDRINRAQKALLAATSHELRTPLAVMRQFSEMLIDREDQFPERYRTYHRHIYRESMRMQFLVENLLSTAKFEYLDFRLSIQPLVLKPWLTDLVDGVAGLDPNHCIKLDCPEVVVRWDEARMAQVITNLLDNGRKHAGTDMDVLVWCVDEKVTIAIRDYGKAPKPDSLRKLRAFKPGRNPKAGLGLGLYLCERIVTAHNGSLSFEDAGPGLRVTIEMPVETGLS